MHHAAGINVPQPNTVIQIVNGGTIMPGFGSTLTARQIDDLIAFLQSRTTNGGRAPAMPLN